MRALRAGNGLVLQFLLSCLQYEPRVAKFIKWSNRLYNNPTWLSQHADSRQGGTSLANFFS
jgi:hypothetical protein